MFLTICRYTIDIVANIILVQLWLQLSQGSSGFGYKYKYNRVIYIYTVRLRLPMVKNWLLKNGTYSFDFNKLIYLWWGWLCNVTAVPPGEKWIFFGWSPVTNSKFAVTKYGYQLVTT